MPSNDSNPQGPAFHCSGWWGSEATKPIRKFALTCNKCGGHNVDVYVTRRSGGEDADAVALWCRDCEEDEEMWEDA